MRLTFLLLTLTSAAAAAPPTSPLGPRPGCVLIVDVATGETVFEAGALCAERHYACSTFKLPLAAMAFDAGLITPETAFKWDGKPKQLRSWSQDQTVASWLAESVVWVSQELTPKLGAEKLAKYLADFRYGNLDLSGGLTTAWLSSTLTISPREQVAMLRRLQRGELAVSPLAVTQTMAALPVAVDEPGLRVVGKTGSGFSWRDPASKAKEPFRVGWYVGFATRGKRSLAFATLVTLPSKQGDWTFSGPEARAVALEALKAVPAR